MIKGHSVSCADAVRTTSAECQCKCRGDFHGGPHTERVRALVWDLERREKYSRSQVNRSKRKAREAIAAGVSAQEACTDFAVTHMIDALIAVTGAGDQQIVRETLKTVIDPFAEVIATGDLDDADLLNIETAVNNLHIICTLCVEILRVIDQLETLAKVVADELAEGVVAALGDRTFLTAMVKQVLKEALTRSFEAVIAVAAADPVKIKMLRVVGFATCPNVKDHPDVEKYCVEPLGAEYVTSALQDWIDQDFPPGSPLLMRTPRRKKARGVGTAGPLTATRRS